MFILGASLLNNRDTILKEREVYSDINYILGVQRLHLLSGNLTIAMYPIAYNVLKVQIGIK